jgi:hypothetical protein
MTDVCIGTVLRLPCTDYRKPSKPNEKTDFTKISLFTGSCKFVQVCEIVQYKDQSRHISDTDKTDCDYIITVNCTGHGGTVNLTGPT